MDELIKLAASSAGFAGVLLIYHLFVTNKEVKELIAGQRRIEGAIHLSTQSDLLRMIASPHVATDLKDAATVLLKDVTKAQEELQKMELSEKK